MQHVVQILDHVDKEIYFPWEGGDRTWETWKGGDRTWAELSIRQCTVFLHNSRRKWSTSGFCNF